MLAYRIWKCRFVCAFLQHSFNYVLLLLVGRDKLVVKLTVVSITPRNVYIVWPTKLSDFSSSSPLEA